MRQDLKNFFQFEVVQIQEKSCINYANRKKVCNECVANCPTNAIQLNDQVPELNHSKCVNCGACIGACPVFAIDHIQKPYQEIYRQIEEFPLSKITCDQAENIQKGIKLPCYLYLDQHLLLAFTKGKEKVSFYIGKCQTCEKVGFDLIQKHFARLEQELALVYRKVKIDLTAEEIQEADDVVFQGITRRELLQNFSIRNIRKMMFAEKDQNEELKRVTDSEKQGKKERNLFKRKKLNQYLQLLSTSRHNKTTLPFGQFLKIESIDKCRGCTICEQICPTEAIKWKNEGNQSKLVFSTQDCIACQRCSACPEQSITYQSVKLDEYVQEPKVLITLWLKECSQCGQAFKTATEEETCEFCKVKQDKDSSRFFAL
ncbi:4Fe-4S dicluster domain-containing protein [Tepidibacillus infernus]|uniref:4Fe-4S dicluster domain-containing protein n=1 Tax=Tepidibacillus TaxID=1494427 RepID=UPI0008537CB0|nr:4Fe-4S dicluster domain-containing protein [Tepidibacillus sp. HK-1]GBF11099.1 ferredoxin [Tepidibacillus sp. HK-1]